MNISVTQRITPFLWYDTQAEEAANFYVSIFKNSKVGLITRYGDTGPGKKGSVMTVAFELDGVQFTALNAGPQFPFTEAVSFVVNCETQEEIDYYWEKLSDGGGKKSRCGWLKDKFGLSWQVVPTVLVDMMHDNNREKSNRVMNAVMEMDKIDISALRKAYHNT